MKLINHIAGIRKKVEPVDVDLTTLINRKSTYQDLKEKYPALSRYDLFAYGFAMFSFGLFTGMGYVNGLKNGNKFIMSIEAASGVMFVIALTFMVAFIAALTAKVKRW
ncbi:MAG TPA: hypothetical protein PKK05_15575 [Leptospiraceae bacterium]|nr:hypothetical protein [Leptospiraceae bacterium]